MKNRFLWVLLTATLCVTASNAQYFSRTYIDDNNSGSFILQTIIDRDSNLISSYNKICSDGNTCVSYLFTDFNGNTKKIIEIPEKRSFGIRWLYEMTLSFIPEETIPISTAISTGISV
ncbi:MAG: hypothetical protein IPM26_12960 [Saprospiraceae bacterium]|nr:hypothetical protein [Saprospiraceae bacterium]